MYGDVFASESVNGDSAFKSSATTNSSPKVVAAKPLGVLRASAVSPDMKWLPSRNASRGAVWDLSTGERKFTSSAFARVIRRRQIAYVDVQKNGNIERNIGRVPPGKSDVQASRPRGELASGDAERAVRPIHEADDGKKDSSSGRACSRCATRGRVRRSGRKLSRRETRACGLTPTRGQSSRVGRLNRRGQRGD